LIPIELHPGEMAIKGSKPRVLHISRKLLEDLWYYRIHERARRERLSGAAQSPLFLTEFGVPWAADGKSFYDVLTEITHGLGIHAGPHVLRHTYATHTLYGMQKGRDRVDPIVFLKEQLGHASILTTMKYVHLVKELANQAVLDYDNEVTEWSRSVA